MKTQGAAKTLQAVRLPVVLIERLDAHAARLRGESPGMEVTRSDAIRSLLTEGLDRVEASRKTKPRARGRA
jgi:hypothetical protein